MSIKLMKTLTFTLGAGLIALSSINVAHATANKCPGANPAESCTTCHGNGSPTKNNGSCPTMTPPPAPAPAPTPGAGNPGTGMPGAGMSHNRGKHMRGRGRGDDDDRGSRRRGRDD